MPSSMEEVSVPLFEYKTTDDHNDGSSDSDSTLFLRRQTKTSHRLQHLSTIFRALFNIVVPIALIGLLWSINARVNFIATKTVSPETENVAPSHATITDCGVTPVQARARGCHFDIMNFGWFPPQCWDQELYDSVVQDYNFTWTTMDNQPITTDEVATGNHRHMLTTWDFHLVHCTYAWQKMVRAVLKQGPIDEWSARYMHAKHCGYELLNSAEYERDAMITKTTLWYPKCGLDADEMLKMLSAHKAGDHVG